MGNKRLIDANAMRDDWLQNGENEYVYDANAVLESIDAQPTVDAVEVVRCKDCKYHYYSSDGYKCGHQTGLIGIVGSDNFCSYGERRGGE